MRPITLPLVATSLTAFVLGVALPLAAHAQVTSQPSPAPDADGVILIGGAETRDGFVKGRPLIETGAYKVHASRRDGPGTTEVHGRDTDIFHVLEGTATLVTGGRVVEGKTSAPDEIRGARIEGGTARPRAKGDIVIIPKRRAALVP
jgi:hypothetical protein